MLLDRFTSDNDATLSSLYVDGKWQCFGLEDEYREEKVSSETRIPAGTYNVTLRTVGGFTERYRRRFGDDHHGMLWIRDVPGFQYILIHIGNTHDDTAGCLLVGCQGVAMPGRIEALGSLVAYEQLYAKVWEAARDENLTISIRNNDL